MPTQREIAARKAGLQSPAAEIQQCEHRSWTPVGHLRCNCSSRPEVYACHNPWVTSGYCIPSLPGKPGEGPIVTPYNASIVPTDARRPHYIPWPIRNYEEPQVDQLICCDTCPRRQDPPPHIARLKALGIVGTHDAATGQSDVLHVLPPTPRPARPLIPVPLPSCVVTLTNNKTLADLVDATQCKLSILYDQPARSLDALRKAYPTLKIWLVGHEATRPTSATPNVWHDLPDDVAANLARQTASAYAEALTRILHDCG